MAAKKWSHRIKVPNISGLVVRLNGRRLTPGNEARRKSLLISFFVFLDVQLKEQKEILWACFGSSSNLMTRAFGENSDEK